MTKLRTSILFFSLLVLSSAQAAASSASVVSEILKLYPNTKIEVLTSVCSEKLENSEVKSAIVMETQPGQFRATLNGSVQCTGNFAAWKNTWVAVRRVLPGERLDPNSFVIQKINVTSGLAHEVRGLLLSEKESLSALEARQTILEGQYPLTSGVQKIPDVKKGESVRIQLRSGDVVLTTPGTTDEPAYINSQLRVTTLKTKHTLLGVLKNDGIVEVKL